jgi:peptide/nickel transport system permease protein
LRLGVSAARKPRSWRDSLVTTASLLGYSIGVLAETILVILFAVQLGWLPAQGDVARENFHGLSYAADLASHLILPRWR